MLFFLTCFSFSFDLGGVDDIFYEDKRFGTVTDSGTATLKARPRVRPLLTFLPLVSTLYVPQIDFSFVMYKETDY